MLHQTDGLSPHSPLRPLSVLVLHLLLTHSCRGQSQVIGPPHPVVAAVGHDIILPCHLEPAADLTAETLEWKRSDLSPRFVHVWRAGHDLVNVKNPSYRGRTSVFTDELKHGNISLKLSKVQLSDQGTYECDIPLLHKQSSVELVVASDTVPSPDISLPGIDRNRGGVSQCESKDDFFEAQSSSSPTINGLAVSLAACIMLLVFFVWRQNKNKTKRSHRDDTDKGERKKRSKTNKTEDQFVTKEEREREQLMTDQTVQKKVLNMGQGDNYTKHLNKRLWREQQKEKKAEEELKELLNKNEEWMKQLQDERIKRQEAEKEVEALKKELETKLHTSKQEVPEHDDASSASHNSTTGFVIEVDERGKYIRLRNTSHQDQRMGGWMLKIQLNDKDPIIYKYDHSFKLRAGKTFTMWVPGYSSRFTPTDLVWKDLKSWSSGDKLQVALISNAGEILSVQSH